jgi:hypothetical protein
MVKLPAILATALAIGTVPLTSPAAAVSPETLIKETTTDVLVQDAGDGDLVAGRIPWELQRHSGKSSAQRSFELYYVKNCRYRLTLEQCYYLYQRDYRYGDRNRGDFRRRQVFRGERVFDRSRTDDLWRLRDRDRVRVIRPTERFKNQRESLKEQIKLRNRQLNRRDQRIDELKDRIEDITERDRD